MRQLRCGALASPKFLGLIHARTQYEKQQPNFARWSNSMWGKFSHRWPQMLTCALFAAANLPVPVKMPSDVVYIGFYETPICSESWPAIRLRTLMTSPRRCIRQCRLVTLRCSSSSRRESTTSRRDHLPSWRRPHRDRLRWRTTHRRADRISSLSNWSSRRDLRRSWCRLRSSSARRSSVTSSSASSPASAAVPADLSLSS